MEKQFATDAIKRCITPDGTLAVNASKNSTAFGEVPTADVRLHTGWTFAYNINPLSVRQTVINGGTVTHSGNMAVVTTGTNPSGVAFIRTEGSINYAPGIGGIARFTAIFDDPQPDSLQLIGIGDSSDGWFFGYYGVDFGIMRRRAGVDNWTFQHDWSEDVKPGFDPKKGNVFEIRFQWLGFGMQFFSMENDAGQMADVHRIPYTNLYTETSVDIPSLPISMGVANIGNTTSISMRSPSAMGGSQGQDFPVGLTVPISYGRSLVPITGADNYLFSILNPSDWQGKDNRLYLQPILLTLAAEGNKPVTFRIRFGTTLTAPVWTDVSSNATPMQYDTSATAVSGGIEVLRFDIAKSGSAVFDLGTILNQRLSADSYITITATTSGISDVSASVTMRSRI
jgi:hypothetical protein